MLNKKLLLIVLAATSSVAFAASSDSLKEAANAMSATSDSFAAAKASSVLEAEKRVVDRYDYSSKMDNSALHSSLSGVTTFNEYSQAKTDAVADANGYTDVLRQEISSGQLSSASAGAPANVEFVSYKKVSVGDDYCEFYYNSSNRSTTIKGTIYSYGKTAPFSKSFTMPGDGVTYIDVSGSYQYTAKTKKEYITATYTNGVFRL